MTPLLIALKIAYFGIMPGSFQDDIREKSTVEIDIVRLNQNIM
jgi:hypothetical protein